jgi:hypothetical protein
LLTFGRTVSMLFYTTIIAYNLDVSRRPPTKLIDANAVVGTDGVLVQVEPDTLDQPEQHIRKPTRHRDHRIVARG